MTRPSPNSRGYMNGTGRNPWARAFSPELGQGDVDFPGVLVELEKIGYDGWIVVEQDVLPGLGAPLESATRNREYLRSIGL